ncbi:MAG: hypothetical protein ABJA87_13515 [bacterium]
MPRLPEVADPPTAADVVELSARSRVLRLMAAAGALVLLTAGALYGQDNDFPFGPMRMYATRDDPNGTVTQVVVVAVAADGRTFDVTNSPGAPRRAELEGQLGQLQYDAARFAAIGALYVTRTGGLRQHPGAHAVEIRLVRRLYPLRGGRAGRATDEVVARWSPP